MEHLCKTIEWLLNSSIPDITNKELLTYQNNIFHEFTKHPNNFKLMGFGIIINK